MIEEPYDTEDVLQRLLADYPSILAGEQVSAGTPRRYRLPDLIAADLSTTVFIVVDPPPAHPSVAHDESTRPDWAPAPNEARA